MALADRPSAGVRNNRAGDVAARVERERCEGARGMEVQAVYEPARAPRAASRRVGGCFGIPAPSGGRVERAARTRDPFSALESRLVRCQKSSQDGQEAIKRSTRFIDSLCAGREQLL